MATYILNWFSTALLNTEDKLNPFYIKVADTQSPYLISPSCLKGSNSETKRLPNQITSVRLAGGEGDQVEYCSPATLRHAGNLKQREFSVLPNDTPTL